MCARTHICERLDLLIHKFAIYSRITRHLETCHGQNIQQTLNPGVTDQLNPCEKWEMYIDTDIHIRKMNFTIFGMELVTDGTLGQGRATERRFRVEILAMWVLPQVSPSLSPT